MIIEKIDSEIKKIPLKTPFITALRRVENVEFVRVTLKCSNDFLGIGEAPATKAITGEDLDEDHSTIENSTAKVVTAFEIFEHLLSPYEVLKSIKSKIALFCSV